MVQNHFCPAILAYGNHYLRGETQFPSVANMYPGGSPAISRIAFLAAGFLYIFISFQSFFKGSPTVKKYGRKRIIERKYFKSKIIETGVEVAL